MKCEACNGYYCDGVPGTCPVGGASAVQLTGHVPLPPPNLSADLGFDWVYSRKARPYTEGIARSTWTITRDGRVYEVK